MRRFARAAKTIVSERPCCTLDLVPLHQEAGNLYQHAALERDAPARQLQEQTRLHPLCAAERAGIQAARQIRARRDRGETEAAFRALQPHLACPSPSSHMTTHRNMG